MNSSPESLQFRNHSLTDLDIEPLLLPAVQSVDFQNCTKLSDKTLQNVALKTHVRSLRWIANPSTTTSGHIFLAYHSNLSTLNISGCDQFSNEACAKHLRSPTLKALDVSFCPLLTDEAFRQISAPLTFLNLQGCPLISDQTIFELCTLKTLKHLFLAFNEKITHKSLELLKNFPLLTLKIYPLDIY